MGHKSSRHRSEASQSAINNERQLCREENQRLRFQVLKSLLQKAQMDITDLLNNENEDDAIRSIHSFLTNTTDLLISDNEEDLSNNLVLYMMAAREVLNDVNEVQSNSDVNRPQLVRQIEELRLFGITIALLGLSSSGKTTLAKVFAPGGYDNFGNTFSEYLTDNIRQYRSNRFNVLDCPGRNDQISYLEMKYIRLWKSVTHRLILIVHTVKEMKNVLALFDRLNLKCVLIVNKFDLLELDERDQFKQQIHNEIRSYGFRCVDFVWFISAKNPKLFQDDWMQMANYLVQTVLL